MSENRDEKEFAFGIGYRREVNAPPEMGEVHSAAAIDGDGDAFVVVPVVGPLDDARKRRISLAFVALLKECLGVKAVEAKPVVKSSVPQ